MKKVLSKDIKKLGDSKFERRKGLFTNFDFEIEHIKGSKNCVPNFLSRENIQEKSNLMVIVTKLDPVLSHELSEKF